MVCDEAEERGTICFSVCNISIPCDDFSPAGKAYGRKTINGRSINCSTATHSQPKTCFLKDGGQNYANSSSKTTHAIYCAWVHKEPFGHKFNHGRWSWHCQILDSFSNPHQWLNLWLSGSISIRAHNRPSLSPSSGAITLSITFFLTLLYYSSWLSCHMKRFNETFDLRAKISKIWIPQTKNFNTLKHFLAKVKFLQYKN